MPNSSPPLAARLFGPAEITLHGEPVRHVRSRKERWLLCLLILKAGRELDRDWFSCLLWPDSGEPIARANLRRSLNDLRRVLGEASCLLRAPQPRTLLLAPGDVDADVLAFDALIARGDPPSLGEAVGLYRGPLLEGCHEDRVFAERSVREEAYLAALERLAAGALAEEDLGAAVGYLRRIVATDPLREPAHRELMQALAAGGSHAAALTVYQELRSLLRQEVHAEPTPETRSLYQQIRSDLNGHGVVSPRSAILSDRAPVGTTPRDNLAHPTTRFIGREHEMEQIRRSLERTRLLTVTGPGGGGKPQPADYPDRCDVFA